MNLPGQRVGRALFPLTLFLITALLLIYPRADGIFFRDGDDPVIFLGDSVTEDGLYPILIESYLLTRFPEWRLAFRNLGVGGDTARLRQRGGLDATLARDIRTLRPKVATINYGLNDARENSPENLAHYGEALSDIVAALRSVKCRAVMLTPTPEEGIHPDAPGGSEYNFRLNNFVLEAEKVAARMGIPSVDLFTPLIRAIEVAQLSPVEVRLIPDAVHPGPTGHWLIATKILKALGAPSLVSYAAIDYEERRVVAQKQCLLHIVSSPSESELVFQRLDACLPWPVPEECYSAADLIGFDPLGELSQYTLQVTRLPEGQYEVIIDNDSAGVFHSLQLEEGQNFSLAPGPILSRMKEMVELIREKNALSVSWNKHVRLYQPPSWFIPPKEEKRSLEEAEAAALLERKRAEEAQRMELNIKAMEAKIEFLRKPISHTWRVVPLLEGDEKE